MFGIGFTEILIVLVIALVVIGPEKLPELMKSLGSIVGDFKKATTDVKQAVSDAAMEKTEKTDKPNKPNKDDKDDEDNGKG